MSLEDFLRANTNVFIGWTLVLILLVAAYLLGRYVTNKSEDADVMYGFSAFSGYMWSIFGVVSILGFMGVLAAQSINYMPKHTENRITSEQDQQSFEQRVQDKAKVNKDK